MGVFFLLALGFIGGGIYLYCQQLEALAAVWKALAAAHALDFQPGSILSPPTISGEIDGIGVRASVVQRKHGKTSVRYVRVATRPALPMPARLGLSPEGLGSALAKLTGGQDVLVGDTHLDGKARICAQNEDDVRGLFADPLLRQACATLFASSHFNRISEGEVVLEKRSKQGEVIHALLAQALEIARALDAARLGPWQHLAAQHDLKLTVEPRWIIASGTVDGLSVQARCAPEAGGAVITVLIPATMPAGLRVVSGNRLGAVPLGDPILDGTVSASGAPDETLKALLRGDALREDLLSVLHAFPASKVEGNTVELVLPMGSTAALEERVRDACRLARALAERAPDERAAAGARAQQAEKTRR